MTTLVYIVMCLCLLAVSAKISLLGIKKGIIYGVLSLLFSWSVMPYAITSARNEVESYLSSHVARQYVAILVTIECAIALAFAFRQWHTTPLNNQREGWIKRVKRGLSIPLWWSQKHYVSLLILPTLFFVQTQVLYALPGVDFRITALLVGVGGLIFFPGMATIFKLALPSHNMREELVLMLSILLCITALLSTTTEEMRFSASTNAPTPFIDYLIALLFFSAFFGLGLLLRVRHKYRSSK